MAGPAAPVTGAESGGGIMGSRVWPSSPAAFWGLTVIILATFMTFLDASIFGMLGERIKTQFGLTDAQLGFLAGPASIICYVFVGFPLARLADIYPRKYVLAASAAVVGTIISLGGLAQNFGQFVFSRVFLAAGGSAHAPASYSLLADSFPPKRVPLAFALLQFGFIGGQSLGPIIGGTLVMLTANWAPSQLGSLTILGWQWILIGAGLPSILIGALFLTVKESPRLAIADDAMQPPKDVGFGRSLATFIGWDAFKAINAKPKVYYPLFFALALSAVDTFGLMFWRTAFMKRTFGWNEGQIGQIASVVTLVSSLLGLILGAALVGWLSRFRKDANVIAATICFAAVTICAIAGPLMPTPFAAMMVFGTGAMFGLAGAVPQNAAVQRIAPNAMRGQVTAMYLFMFTFFGALGSWFVGLIQTYVVGDEAQIWKGLVITAVLLLPAATLMMFRAIKPYREEVERLEALEKEALNV